MADVSIGEWLSSIDLKRYEVNFRRGGFETVDQCLDMNESDLITLDITSSGHMKVILANLQFLKKFAPSPSKSEVDNGAGSKRLSENIHDEVTYSNVIYNAPSENSEGCNESDPAIYGNVDYIQPTSPWEDVPCQSDTLRSVQKKRPVPAPRNKCLSQHQTNANECAVYDQVAERSGNAKSSKMKEEDDIDDLISWKTSAKILSSRDPPQLNESHFSRSISLPSTSLANDAGPPCNNALTLKKTIVDLPIDPRPPAYANIIHSFNKSELKTKVEVAKDLKDYENVVFKNNTLSMDNCLTGHEDMCKCFSLPQTLEREKQSRTKTTSESADIFKSPLYKNLDYGLDKMRLDSCKQSFLCDNSSRVESSRGLQLSDSDISYLENLMNRKAEGQMDLLNETSDSLTSRESLPPPSYPPPPLIISGKEVKVSPGGKEGQTFPSLPPRPGLKKFSKQAKKDEDNSPFSPRLVLAMKPPTPEDQYSIPLIKSMSPLLPPKPKDAFKCQKVTPKVDENLYCLETDDQATNSTSQSLKQPPSLPKKTETFAKFEGFLTRQGENKWFVLDRENLSCYNSEKLKHLVEAIPLRKIGSLSSAPDNRCELSFEIFLKTPNSSLVLTADNLDWKHLWLIKLARLIACVCEEDLGEIQSFERAGNLYTKSSASPSLLQDNNWCLKWFHLDGKSMYVYNEDDRFHVIDLRKAQPIRNLSLSFCCKTSPEDSPPFRVESPDLRIYLQGNTKHDTAAWLKSLHSAMSKLDPSNLHDHQLTPSDVPIVVDKCIAYVTMSGMETEGIYRLSGQNSKVTRLLEMFYADARGTTIKPEEFQVHDVSNCLKRFFRQLQDPLFTRKFYNCWIEALTVKDMGMRLMSYKKILGDLSKVNYSTIKFVMSHLVEVIRESKSNKMDSVNIASIFGPILVSVDKGEMSTVGYQSTNHEITIVKDFLENYAGLFDIDEREAEMERNMREARKRIEQLNKTSPEFSNPEQAIQLKGMLVSIQIDNDGCAMSSDVITTQVLPTMSASELEGTIVEKLGGCGDFKEWRLFEVVCNGELERLINSDECILSILLKYKDWPQELRINNSLLFKKTDLLQTLQLCLETKMFLWDDMKFALKKSFKKYYFEFTRCNLSYRKDPKSAVIGSWKVEELVLYMGVQKKRCPPTEFGITFYHVNMQLTGPFLGCSICFATEIQMYKWLAMLLNAQQPIGLFDGTRKTSSLVKPSASSESCPNLPSRSGLRPMLPSYSKPIFNDFDMDINQEILPEDAAAMSSTLSSSSSSSSSMVAAPTRPCHPLELVQGDMMSGITTSSSCSNINDGQAPSSVLSKFLNKFTKAMERSKE